MLAASSASYRQFSLAFGIKAVVSFATRCSNITRKLVEADTVLLR